MTDYASQRREMSADWCVLLPGEIEKHSRLVIFLKKLSGVWHVATRSSMQLDSKQFYFEIVCYSLISAVWSDGQLKLASCCALSENKKYGIFVLFHFDFKSSLGTEHWSSLILCAVVLTHALVQPTHWQCNSSLAYGDTVGEKCQLRCFFAEKGGIKEWFTHLHLDHARWEHHQLTFCLVIEGGHMSAW